MGVAKLNHLLTKEKTMRIKIDNLIVNVPNTHAVTFNKQFCNLVSTSPNNDWVRIESKNSNFEILTNETTPEVKEPSIDVPQQTIVEKMIATLTHVGKINAIRDFRAATGAGLLESKKFVEMYMPPQPTLTERVQNLLDADNKIDAISEVQNTTGCSLESAKAFVNAMLPFQRYEDKYSGWLADVIRLIRNGRFIDGLKLYRQYTQCTLHEAKFACDNLRDAINDGKL